MDFIKKENTVIIESTCKECGGVEVKMFQGKGPHVAELRCKECGRHNQWMGKGDYEVYQCYLTDSPIDALMQKITEADSEYKKVDIEGDWIERKNAQKYYNKLIEWFYKTPGHMSFTVGAHD